MSAPTRYARHGDVHLGFDVLAPDRHPTLLQIGSGVFASVFAFDQEPNAARFTNRLAAIARIVRYDMRGIGRSDRLATAPILSDQVGDALAVLNEADVERAYLMGVAFGGPTAVGLAAHHPERVAGLILCNTAARVIRARDYPFGITETELEARRTSMTRLRGTADSDAPDSSQVIMPSLAGDAQFREWWARAGSEGASPSAARQQYEPLFSLDLRDQVRRITVPTLVLQSPETWLFRPEFGAYLADHIAGARLVELECPDRLPFGANVRVALDEIEEFLTGSRLGATRDRILITLLFTDICGSTATAATLGDDRWRSQLDIHDEIVRRQLRLHGAREVNTLGDGFLAAFDSVASAIYCARAICHTAAAAGIDVRSGVHSGECEQRGADIAGMAVHIAARIAALGDAGDVLVSRTVRDLVVGSELRFTPRGEHVLKGVPESWQIYALDNRRATAS